jgi:hypothetical protein
MGVQIPLDAFILKGEPMSIMEDVVKKKLEEIREAVRLSCKEYVGKTVGSETVYKMKAQIYESIIRVCGGHDEDHIDLKIYSSPIDQYTIKVEPGNLFTFILMYGIYVPYYLVHARNTFTLKKATGYFPVGTTFDFKQGAIYYDGSIHGPQAGQVRRIRRQQEPEE